MIERKEYLSMLIIRQYNFKAPEMASTVLPRSPAHGGDRISQCRAVTIAASRTEHRTIPRLISRNETENPSLATA